MSEKGKYGEDLQGRVLGPGLSDFKIGLTIGDVAGIGLNF